MTVNDIIIYIMILFSLVGAADWIIGKRFGLGEKFEEGLILGGYITSSMLGATILFNIPVGLGIIDKAVTEKLATAGKYLDIPLLDHCIIAGGTGELFSFKANGLMDEIRQNMRSDICER